MLTVFSFLSSALPWEGESTGRRRMDGWDGTLHFEGVGRGASLGCGPAMPWEFPGFWVTHTGFCSRGFWPAVNGPFRVDSGA